MTLHTSDSSNSIPFPPTLQQSDTCLFSIFVKHVSTSVDVVSSFLYHLYFLDNSRIWAFAGIFVFNTIRISITCKNFHTYQSHPSIIMIYNKIDPPNSGV